MKEKKLFSNIECHHFGSTDAGLMTIEGKLVKGVSMQDAEAGVMDIIHTMIREGISEKELEKVKNKTESMMAFEDMSVMNRATSLAIYELLEDANLINLELDRYQSVNVAELQEECQRLFDENNSNTLCYYAQPNA